MSSSPAAPPAPASPAARPIIAHDLFQAEDEAAAEIEAGAEAADHWAALQAREPEIEPFADPADRIRADALPGRAVRLRDGQEWTFPAVVITFGEDDTRPSGYGTATNIGARFDRELHAQEDATSGDEVIRGVVVLAGELLRRNYDLTVAECAQLMRFRFQAGAVDPLRYVVERIANGLELADAPKPSGDGSR